VLKVFFARVMHDQVTSDDIRLNIELQNS